MFQRDDTNNGIYVDTRQVYGWTQNVQVAIPEVDQKWTTADRILRYFRNKYGAKPGWEEPPQSWAISNSMNFSAWDLATIILYNGSTGCPQSEILNDGGQKITVTFPWTFDASRTPKWSFTDNVNGYATKIVADEWEGKQTNEE
jgi:acyl-CoA synthetase (AMP-forming)/AMP-acid ligase II